MLLTLTSYSKTNTLQNRDGAWFNHLILSSVSFHFLFTITLIVVLSRVPQIFTNFRNKSTGQLAFLTFFLSFAGSAARLATVMFETNDFLFQLTFILSVALNGFIVLQFFLYWNSSQGKIQPKKDTVATDKKKQ